MSDSKFFIFSKTDPVADDYTALISLADELDIYMGYHTFKDKQSALILKGFLVLPRRFSIWGASDLLPGFTFSYVDKFQDVEDVIKETGDDASDVIDEITEDLRSSFQRETE